MRLDRCVLAASLLALTVCAQAAVPTTDRAMIKPTEEQARATELITHFIANYHYKKTPLDDRLSEQVLEKYLEGLDPNRSFFTADDIAVFNTRAHLLDDDLRRADLQPAFNMFLAYRDRVADRAAHARRLLDTPFDYTVEEDYLFDRSEASWPRDRAELDEIWRQRVKNDVLSLKLAGKKDDEIKNTLIKRYDSMQRQTEQLNSDDVYQLFMNAYTTAIEPHTSYFSPRSSENFKIRMSLSLEGIGAVLQTDNEYTVVREVVPGGPADKSGLLHADDRIVGLAQGTEETITDVVGWRLDDVVDLIRGPKGSVVRLQVLPKGVGVEGPTREVSLTRNKIALEEQAAQKSVIELPGVGGTVQRIGVIELPTFYMDFEARARGEKNYRSTTRDVRKLLTELIQEGVDGVVIDLRGNGGGSLTEATELTGLFIRSGPIVQVRDSTGRIQIDKDPDPGIAFGGPLAVLVDRNSASASEIFAGAIQDYQRGVIVGEPTFGKGTVQNLVDLDQFDRESGGGGLGQLKATIAQFFRVAGGSTQHKGVVPDIIYPIAIASDEQGERAFSNALPWDEVTPAEFVPVRAPVDTFVSVREAHEQRIAASPEFQILLEEYQAIRDVQSQKTVTLVESKRRAEQTKQEQATRDRENRLRTLRGQPPLAESMTLEEMLEEKEDKEARRANDAMLRETAHILADLLVPPVPTPAMADAVAPAVKAN